MIKTIKTKEVEKNDEDRKKENEAMKIRKRFESNYFSIECIYLTNLNLFSYYFIDYEFKTIKSANTERPEKQPEDIYLWLQIKRKQMDFKDVKLIEEIILSLNEENKFLYLDEESPVSKNFLSKTIFNFKYKSCL